MKDSAGVFYRKTEWSFVYSPLVVVAKGWKNVSAKDVQYQKPGEYTVDLEEINAEMAYPAWMPVTVGREQRM